MKVLDKIFKARRRNASYPYIRGSRLREAPPKPKGSRKPPGAPVRKPSE